MEESPLPNAQTNRFFFSPVLLLLGFFFFSLPLGCVSVCQHSHDWVFIRLASGSGPCKRSDRCILSIRAAVQFAAFRICTTCTWWREWRRGAGINRQSSWRETRDSTHHASLSLYLCCVDLMCARQLRWDDVVMCSSFWIITALVSKETSFFFFFVPRFAKC